MAASIGSSVASAASAASAATRDVLAATRDVLYDAISHRNEVGTKLSFLDGLEAAIDCPLEVTVNKKGSLLRRSSSATLERPVHHIASGTADVTYTQGRAQVQDIHHYLDTVTIAGKEASVTVLLQAHLDDGTACGAAVLKLKQSLIAELARTDTVEDALKGLFEMLNLDVREALPSNPYGGTSILLVLQTADRVYIANSGRSRAILMNKTHANFQECPLTFASSATGIESEDSNCLITTIQKDVETDIEEGSTRVGYREGDLILLANQGFTNIVSDLYARIALDRMKDKSYEEQTQRLVRSAFNEGSDECLMVILLKL